ncbi:MAG: recombinase RecT [Clostridium sp.]|nr:recombinase RecT [Clostridium sp.]
MAQTKIQTAVKAQAPEAKAQQSVMQMMNGLLDGEKMRKRFDDLLGKRSAQFISSLVNMVNDNQDLQEAFYQSPMSVIKSALQAASYDLPIDPTLGYAYIVPFNNRVTYKDANGNKQESWKKQATFIIGYKGMVQLCLRTGAYQCVPDAVDVREGELVSYNRLTGDAEFKWIEDEDEREKLPVIGYAGYLRLKNGAEKTVYMTVKQIEAHEKKNRKGQWMSKGWKENFDAMAKKTVIRKLCSHYALMSIEYQDNASRETMNLVTALAASDSPVSEVPENVVEYADYTVDESTGEILPENSEEFDPDADMDGAKLPWEENA